MSSNHQLQQLKRGENVASRAIWLEGTLVVTKIIAGTLSGSLALISDAVHSASDIVSIVTSWLGLKIAQKKPSKKFPYGYYKAESLGTLLISLLILYAGFEMAKQGLTNFQQPSQINLPAIALAVSAVDAVTLFIFGNYEIKVGQETGARSLVAMGRENRTHIFSSSAVFIGTLSAYFNIPYIESIITIGISFLIFEIGFTSLRDAILALMDVSPDSELEDKIKKIAEDVSGVEQAYEIKLRQAGPMIFGEVKVGIRRSIDINRSHRIVHQIKDAARAKISNLSQLLVHVEPLQSDYHHLVIPVEDKNKLQSKIASEMSRAPYFLCVNLKQNELQGFYFLENPHQQQKQKAGLAVAKMLIKTKADVVITPNIGEIAFHALREHLFDVYQTDCKVAKEVISTYKNNKLNLLHRANKSS